MITITIMFIILAALIGLMLFYILGAVFQALQVIGTVLMWFLVITGALTASGFIINWWIQRHNDRIERSDN